MSPKHWLMKAEPDSRVVKGKDVKFSVDDFEECKTTPWEGVRNAEARNLMKEMRVGDKVLFYHSNCKKPGIAAFAEVSKEAYPDYTAWDPSHPYYDAKSDKENPKWYMVEVTFKARASHFVPLSFFKSVAASADVPENVAYIEQKGSDAIKAMALINRGRLSVQRVEEDTYNVIEQLANQGGWENVDGSTSQAKAKGKEGRTKAKPKSENQAAEYDDERVDGSGEDEPAPRKPARSKRKVHEVDGDSAALRRSTRVRK
ncbi:PUA-like domain-containing protein [Epithele typhae]|uniref:PUA-like domain-containing protein n=1 Tax=Epithele typhae TaxID=378194 RepID=UPI002008B5A9|nr:PUA-like domain-containing protein [Epithele typhae]KAH9939251.1 PUA-like domain-containing protein [Epithele typhae]